MMSIIDLERKANDLRELRRMAEEINAEITSIEDELKAHMAAREVTEINGNNFRITWKEVTSSRLDCKALKVTAPAIWEQFSRQTTSRRFMLA